MNLISLPSKTPAGASRWSALSVGVLQVISAGCNVCPAKAKRFSRLKKKNDKRGRKCQMQSVYVKEKQNEQRGCVRVWEGGRVGGGGLWRWWRTNRETNSLVYHRKSRAPPTGSGAMTRHNSTNPRHTRSSRPSCSAARRLHALARDFK